MPLFEYECLDCRKRFEQFVSGGGEPRCPSCDGGALRKLLSVFAVSGGTPETSRDSSGACGSCGDPRGPGSCSVN